MKKYRIIVIILCFMLLAGVIPETIAVSEQEQGSVAGCYGLDAATPYLGYGQIVENTQAVFLYERTSNTLMYTQNPDAKVYPSSLVKILTAYLAVVKGNLDDVVTVREETIEQVPYDAVSADLAAGEQLTLRDLLYCMMVGSANDAASVIAVHISGTESAFVDEMNAFALEAGCTATQFRNPHGLHHEEQYSTVRDLAKIISAVIDNEQFHMFFSATEYTVPATNLSPERELESTNFLMASDSMEIYYDNRVTGGRTGIGNDDKRCMATTAEADGMELICILMGADSKKADDGRTLVYGGFKETTALYDAVFDSYKVASVIYSGQPLRQISVVNGRNDVVIGSRESTNAILPRNVSHQDLVFRYSDMSAGLEAPVNAGDPVSGVEIWYGNMCIAYADLYAMNSSQPVPAIAVQEQPEQTDTSSEEERSSGKTIIIVSIVFFVIIGVLAYFFRSSAKRKVTSDVDVEENGRRRRQ